MKILLNKMFYDITRQTRLTTGISSVDVDNGYNKILHAIMVVPFGVTKAATGAMLSLIQEMIFSL